jgi:dihydroorotate dehydrogenase electron transfer subunit
VQRLGGDNYRITCSLPQIAGEARPGQFVEVGTGGATLLNKPFSIARTDPAAGTFDLVFKVVGPGTAAIAAYRPGCRVKVIGPCGNGFPAVPEPAWIVGGGIGIPPLSFLVSRTGPEAVAGVALGARTAVDVVLADEFQALTTVPPVITTDDGSAGRRGFVTDVLKEWLAQTVRPVCACGPAPMLRRVAQLCDAAGAPLYACLEAYMGCGTGICMGCVIPTVRGMERVCREGPVFMGSDILWNELPEA